MCPGPNRRRCPLFATSWPTLCKCPRGVPCRMASVVRAMCFMQARTAMLQRPAHLHCNAPATYGRLEATMDTHMTNKERLWTQTMPTWHHTSMPIKRGFNTSNVLKKLPSSTSYLRWRKRVTPPRRTDWRKSSVSNKHKYETPDPYHNTTKQKDGSHTEFLSFNPKVTVITASKKSALYMVGRSQKQLRRETCPVMRSLGAGIAQGPKGECKLPTACKKTRYAGG